LNAGISEFPRDRGVLYPFPSGRTRPPLPAAAVPGGKKGKAAKGRRVRGERVQSNMRDAERERRGWNVRLVSPRQRERERERERGREVGDEETRGTSERRGREERGMARTHASQEREREGKNGEDEEEATAETPGEHLSTSSGASSEKFLPFSPGSRDPWEPSCGAFRHKARGGVSFFAAADRRVDPHRSRNVPQIRATESGDPGIPASQK